MNVDTKPYRQKYAKRPAGRYMAYPPGGADVKRLCDAIELLTRLVRDIQSGLPTEQQNEVERQLWHI